MPTKEKIQRLMNMKIAKMIDSHAPQTEASRIAAIRVIEEKKRREEAELQRTGKDQEANLNEFDKSPGESYELGKTEYSYYSEYSPSPELKGSPAKKPQPPRKSDNYVRNWDLDH